MVPAARTATSSAKLPGSVNPGWRWWGHTWPSPAAQVGQAPHAKTKGAVTARPTHPASTPAPTDSTTPASSWPGTCGKVAMSGSWPIQPCQSLRHSPVRTTRTTASPGPATGSGRWVTWGVAPKAS